MIFSISNRLTTKNGEEFSDVRIRDRSISKFVFLDILRGAAILWIVCFHLLKVSHLQYWNILEDFISQGYLGVVVFFVVSGYTIGIASDNEAYYQRPFLYIKRRFKRIYFPYWWSLLVAVAADPFVRSLASLREKGEFTFTHPFSLLEWINVFSLSKIFTADSWVLSRAFDPLNAPIWFIAVVVQVYVLVAIAFFANKYFGRILFIVFIISLSCYHPDIKKVLPYGVFLPYFSYIYLGYVSNRILHRKATIGSVSLNTIVLIAIFSLTVFLACVKSTFCDLSLALFIAYLILTFHQYDEKLCKIRSLIPLRLLGIFSYSIYLLHFPLRIPSGIIATACFPFFSTSLRSLIVVFLSILLSTVFFFYFEQPINPMSVIKGFFSPVNTLTQGWTKVVDSLRS